MKSIRRINSTGSVLNVASLLGLSTRGVPLRTSGLALMAMVLLGMALWSTPADGSEDGNEPAEPLWSAEMTVVEYTSVSIGAASADLFANVGGSGNLQIKSLWSHVPDRDLRLAFDEGVADAADYTLQVGGLSLEFPDDSSGASSFKWNDVDVDWQDGQVIHVRIVLTSEIDALPANSPTPEVSEISETTTVDAGEHEQKPQFLVSNLGVNVATGVMRPLNAARPGFAQAFTTGTKTDGYAFGSVGIQVLQFSDGSTVGDHLQVTINGVASGGEPGDAHCTLTNPSSFSTPGVIAFEAPTGAGSCPQLATETTYFVVIEWVNPSGTDAFALIPQTYSTEETAATEEDPGGAEGWSIADESYYLAVSSDARTWTAYDETASFKIKVKEAADIAAKANSPATGLPTISGTAQVGETLTADSSAIADEDGLDDVSYSYQWIRSDNGADTDIAGETDSTYTLVSADQGKTNKVKVSFLDDAHNAETRTSAATETVAAKPNTPATGLPNISGTPQVGETLTADTSPIDDADGLTGATFEYQWIAGGTDIAGATGSSYELTSSEQGQTIQVRVTFSDDADNEETLTSAATVAVAARPNTAPTGAPTISGTPQVGQTLTADAAPIDDEDGLTSAAFEYQWIAGGSDTAGATGSSYELTSSEQGQTIQVRVTFTDDADNEEMLTSAATVAVAAAPVPLSVALKVAAPASHDGSSEFTFEIEFSEEFGLSYVTLRDFAFTETGGEVRRAQRMDKPSNIRWLITVEPDGDGDVTIVLPVTTDCDADGAICTGDKRTLSNSLTASVSGPGE